jgi:hypothetical protein
VERIAGRAERRRHRVERLVRAEPALARPRGVDARGLAPEQVAARDRRDDLDAAVLAALGRIVGEPRLVVDGGRRRLEDARLVPATELVNSFLARVTGQSPTG